MEVCEKIRSLPFFHGYTEIQFAVACDATKENPGILNDLGRAQVEYLSIFPLDPQYFGFLDPDPRDKISFKNFKSKLFIIETQIWTVKNERLLKNSYR